MKILVFSDSHGSMQGMIDAVNTEIPDMIIHLGDHIRDADRLTDLFPAHPVIRVAGNCDYTDAGSGYLLRELDGIRFFITHGHQYGVKTGLLRLSYAAMETGAAIVLFGHTHRPMLQEPGNGPILFNPGSCGAVMPTYGVIQILNGTPRFEHKSAR